MCTNLSVLLCFVYPIGGLVNPAKVSDFCLKYHQFFDIFSLFHLQLPDIQHKISLPRFSLLLLGDVDAYASVALK